MNEEYWIKYGFKENGELICVRTLSNSKPNERFFYLEKGINKEVKNPKVVILTKNNINQFSVN